MLEFAFVAPPLLLLIMGTLDVGHQLYTSTVLQGTLQKAARAATLESATGSITEIDQKIKDQVKTVMSGADVTITRTNFQNFSDAVTPEKHTDTNGDKICNNGEAFEDLNNNSTWDKNRGRIGLGGANDAVVFKAELSYERPLPMGSLIGLSDEVTIVAQTVLRNQPYNLQTNRAPVARNCP